MRPIVSPRTRGPLLVTAAVCWVLVIALGFAVHGGGWPDGRLAAWLVTLLGAHAGILLAVTDPVTTLVVLGVLLVAGAVVRRWSVAALAVLGPGLTVLLTEFLLKPAFHRHLHDYLSYPSGHDASASAAFTAAALVLARGAWRSLVPALWLLVWVLGAAGLVAAGYHYATDTLAGVALAVGVVVPLAAGLDVLSRRRAQRGAATSAR